MKTTNKNIHIVTITEAAKRYGCRFELLGNMISRVNNKEKEFFFYDFVSPQTSIVSTHIFKDKSLTKYFFEKEGLPTPRGVSYREYQKKEAYTWFNSLNTNIVIKPVNSMHSAGISLNIQNKDEFDRAWEKAFRFSKKVLLEEMVQGADHRLVIIGKKFVAATRKTPPEIIGNGYDTIIDLIEKLNQKRALNPHTASKKKVVITKEFLKILSSLKLNINSILENNRRLQLSLIPNVSAGGTHEDITEVVHKGFQEVVENISKRLPPHGYMAIDILASDITKSPHEQNWYVIEINESLSLPHNHYPLIGKGRDVGGKIIEQNLSLIQTHDNSNNNYDNTAPIYYENEINYTTKSIKKKLLFRAARERNLSVKEINSDIWYVTDNNSMTHYFKYIMPDTMSTVAQKITAFKHISLKLLKEKNIPIPQSKIFKISEIDEAWKYAYSLKNSVVKPYSGSGGSGVFINIKNKTQFDLAVERQNKNKFLVEKYLEGQDYRVLVIDNHFVAASLRVPAYVIGDGINTLKSLIDQKNFIRKKNPYSATKLINISITREKELQKEGISLNTVIPKSQKIELQKVANVSAGGENIDISDSVHFKFKQKCVEILQVYPDLFMGGIDLLARDLTKDPDMQEWAVIEVNANPDLQMHHFPVKGIKRDVSGVLIDSLFKDYKNNVAHNTFYFKIYGDKFDQNLFTELNYNAHLFALDGWIKKDKDGFLELVVKGMPKPLEEFIENLIVKNIYKIQIESIKKFHYKGIVNKGFFLL